jgi:hypothetical protein
MTRRITSQHEATLMRTTTRSRGQALVIMVVAMIAVIAGAGLIIDGGNG